ncbi:unnamed protein product [Heligmosomoides polygyrus]|uniref:Uncharacterized protein n=1 Tax=Heligmosomoides polygyrus TaxID=6339 RepID=A0A3P7ZTK2_HELPZ|nr:unnamed protein product [Heligmosomoides polygyrus]
MLPSNIWSYMALNMMWILNSGVYPIIYFIVNKAIRDRLGAKRGVLPSVSMYSRGNNSMRTGSRTFFVFFATSSALLKAPKPLVYSC